MNGLWNTTNPRGDDKVIVLASAPLRIISDGKKSMEPILKGYISNPRANQKDVWNHDITFLVITFTNQSAWSSYLEPRRETPFHHEEDFWKLGSLPPLKEETLEEP